MGDFGRVGAVKHGKAKRKNPVKKRSARGKRVQRSTCTAVCVVDQQPFLQAAVKTCRRLSKELDTKREKLRQFEELDQTAFRTWLHHTFGSLLTRTRELQKERADYDFILAQLEACSMFAPEKFDEVYAELMERKANDTLRGFMPPKPEDDEMDDDDPFADRPPADEEEASGEGDGEADMFRKLREAFHQDFGHQFSSEQEELDAFKEQLRETFGGFSFDMGEAAVERFEATHKSSVLKALYRVIVKRLHPDRSTMDPSRRDKHWHDLQAAYERGDLEGIRRIEAMCDMEESGLSTGLGLARLRELAGYYLDHLGPLRAALSDAKKDPSFGFATQGAGPALKAKVGRDLNAVIQHMTRDIEALKADIEEMAMESEFEDDDEDDEDDEEFLNALLGRVAAKAPKKGKQARRDDEDSNQMDLF